MTDHSQLSEKLKKLEALHAGTIFSGERDAAAAAIESIRAKLQTLQQTDPPVEYKFTMTDVYSRKLLVALLRRYGLRPYRYHGQRYTTVMVRVSQSFVDDTLWPEFCELNRELETYLQKVTDDLISNGVDSDTSEAESRPESRRLPAS